MWRQTARSHGTRGEGEVAPCTCDAKMASSWGGIPKAGCQLQSTAKLLGQRGQWGVGWGRQPLLQPRDDSLTQRILSELLAGRAPNRLFSPRGLCAEYRSSSLAGPPHRLALVTEKVTQNEGSS